MTTDNPQGLEPSTVWTREYVRTELWANVHGDPLPLDADPEPGDIDLGHDAMLQWLAEDCETVVDVGCGWMPYEDEGVTLTGADVSPAMLELAEALHPDRTFVETSAFDLPFADGAFDGVRSSGMLRHIEDWRTPLRELARVADRRLTFTILTDDDPRKCGKYQWCTTPEAIIDTLPDKAEVTDEIHHSKDAWAFDSTRFKVMLP